MLLGGGGGGGKVVTRIEVDWLPLPKASLQLQPLQTSTSSKSSIDRGDRRRAACTMRALWETAYYERRSYWLSAHDVSNKSM